MRNAIFWLTTVLFSLAMAASGFGAVSGGMAEAFTAMGYPAYFVTLLGTWKLLGALALVTPGFPKVTEWAYAGFFFTLTGASFSHLSSGHGLAEAIPPMVMLGLAITSYFLRSAKEPEAAPALAHA